LAKCAQHRRKLVDIGAAAAKLRGHPGFDQSGRFQQREIVGDELIFIRCLMRALRDDRPEAADNVDNRASLGRTGIDGLDDTHDVFLRGSW
jgi:hypothetical protein